MAKFLTGNKLNTEIENLFENAKQQIILISPYIKLHDRYKSTLRAKIDNPQVKVIVVCGKNEGDYIKSIRQEDFEFFKAFPNIEIRYEKRLHAKYYANEEKAILTSMNLYSYSQDNNIEAGVMTSSSLLGEFTTNIVSNLTGSNSLDDDAFFCFERVINQSDLLFKKTAHFDKGMLGTGLNKKYINSTIEEDKLSSLFSGKSPSDDAKFNIVRDRPSTSPPSQSTLMGYCIRTGKVIPFNAKRPMSDEAYQSWCRYKNEAYPEKFCHFSGELSNGETSFSKPILRKNWTAAKQAFNL